jgi:hypothetical protein
MRWWRRLFGIRAARDMKFDGLVVECRREGSVFCTYFAIPPGREEAAGRDLLRCLADGMEVWLRNDLDEGGEGATLFRCSRSGLETMFGGHGWSSSWTATDEAGVCAAVRDLAVFNRGGHWAAQGELIGQK